MEYSPLKVSERFEIIDVLRGIAIFGILMVNLPYMYEPMTRILLGAKPDASFDQLAADSFIRFFFEGKFYVMFSMLFGFGFWIFMSKKVEEGPGILPVFSRRLFFLLLFGLAHVVLLWAGDILVFYALFGFLLILFRKSSDRKVFKWAVWLTLIPTILSLLMMVVFALFSMVPEAKTGMDSGMQERTVILQQLVEKATVTYSTGTFSEMVSIRLKEYQFLLGGILFFYPVVLGMFLLGMLAARKGLISNYPEHLPFFRRIFWWGLGIGVVTNGLYVIAYQLADMQSASPWSLLVTSMHTFGGISFGLCYVSIIVFLFAGGKSDVLKKFFAPVGRMALTNYLLQTVICTTIFYSYGFGLYGKIAAWQGILLTIVIFTAQVFFSRWWLSRYRFGPFEWLWRSLTYWKVQPIMKNQQGLT